MRVQTMRRTAVVFVTFLAATLVVAAKPADPGLPPAAPMLTVDSIMRGPKLVGAAPTGLRWSKDSTKLYFSWQKAGEERASSYVVNRDGTGLRQLTPEESRTADAPIAGRPDRAHKRLLAAEGGDIVVYDASTGARRVLLRTATIESNPRWARNDTAITFMRDGNLFLLSLTPGDQAAFT